VVSTPITDVIDPYGREGLVAIAENPQEFIDKLSAALPTCHCTKRLAKVDRFLARTSWDLTWFHMSDLIEAAMRRKAASQVARTHSGLLVQPRPAVGD
jgi:hypothetical protein